MRWDVRVLLGWLVAAAVAPCWGAGARVEVRPCLDGWFRPGVPMCLRAEVWNEGPARDAEVAVVVEGIAYRQAVRLPAGGGTAAEFVVGAAGRPRAVGASVRDGGGGPLFAGAVELAVRPVERGHRLVVWVGAAQEAEGLSAADTVVAGVQPGALPAAPAGYAAADAVVVEGDGEGLPEAVRGALCAWVRGGGLVVFRLDASAPVTEDGLAAELALCPGRATGAEWLRALAEGADARAVGGGLAWDVGLGRAVAGRAEALDVAALGRLLPAGLRTENPAVDAELYEAFEEPRLAAATRWRLVGGALALVVAGAVLVAALPRGWSRRTQGLAVAALAAGLAAAAWGWVRPPGRGGVGVAAVVEGGGGPEAWARRTEVACVGAVGRGGVRLDFGHAEAVVPVYYEADDAGRWDDVVVSRDAAGRWTLECGVRRGVRRCVAASWPARVGRRLEGPPAGRVWVRDEEFKKAAGPPGEGAGRWRPLDELPSEWGRAAPLVRWQARRRAGRGGPWAVARVEATETRCRAERGVAEWRIGPGVAWNAAAGE